MVLLTGHGRAACTVVDCRRTAVERRVASLWSGYGTWTWSGIVGGRDSGSDSGALVATINNPLCYSSQACMYLSDFIQVGGFSKSLSGWGREDHELYERVLSSKTVEVRLHCLSLCAMLAW